MLIAFVVVARAGCPSACDDEPVASVASPDRRHTALVVARGCGATADFVTAVQVESAGWLSSSRQDVLVIRGSESVGLVWSTDGKTLQVKVSSGVGPRDVFLKTEDVDGIRIFFR